MFKEHDKVRLASGEEGEIAVLDGPIARVWVDGGLRLVNVSIAVLGPIDAPAAASEEALASIQPAPPAAISINRRPGAFNRSVRNNSNPIFQEFLKRLGEAGIMAQPQNSQIVLDELQRTRGPAAAESAAAIGSAHRWPEADIQLVGEYYILAWCGMARLEKPAKNWMQIEAIWKAL